MAGTVPPQAIALIQEFEGCHRIDPEDGLVHAYPDPLTLAEPWTIGWGTTRYPDGRPIGKADAITKKEADQCFAAQLQETYWEPISRSIPYWLEMNDPMRSALCSFAYNLGAGFYGAEGFNTISARLREKHWEDVPAALMLYINPGSPVEAGLRRRRQAEGNLWQQGLEQLTRGDAIPTPIFIKAITETFLKKENRASNELAPHQLVPVEPEERWRIEALLEQDGKSQQVRLAYGAGDWWIYSPHWLLPSNTSTPAPAPSPAQGRPQQTRT